MDLNKNVYEDIKILFVDDLPPNWKLGEAFFKRLGCSGVYAENGKEAIEKLEVQQFDLCLMDIHMPVMDGLEAIKYIRENMTNEMPIIVMVGTATHEDLDKAIVLGANGSCDKPLSMDKIKQVIDKYVINKKI